MEKQKCAVSSSDSIETKEAASWDRKRSTSEILGFIARREAMIAELDEEL